MQDLNEADIQDACSKLRGVSPECMALLTRIFVIDPERRLSLPDIMQVRWCAALLQTCGHPEGWRLA